MLNRFWKFEFVFLVCSRRLQKPTPLSTQAWIISLWIYLSFIRNGSCLLSLGKKSIPWQNHYLHPSPHPFFFYETVAWVYTTGFGLSAVFPLLPPPAPSRIQYSSNHNKHSGIVIRPSWGCKTVPLFLYSTYVKENQGSLHANHDHVNIVFEHKILNVWWWFLFIYLNRQITVGEI